MVSRYSCRPSRYLFTNVCVSRAFRKRIASTVESLTGERTDGVEVAWVALPQRDRNGLKCCIVSHAVLALCSH